MDILYLIIILILLVIYLKSKNSNETFLDNIFGFLTENNYNNHSNKIISLPNPQEIEKLIKPDYLPHKIKDQYYCGKLVSNEYIENKKELYLYGMPIENVHKLYKYLVISVNNEKIENELDLVPREKVELGGPIMLNDGPKQEGPYILS